jgi:HK97 family phage major capsid protein
MMSEETQKGLHEVIEDIGKGFKQFREVNDKRLEEEAAGNKARAQELSESLEKINDKLTDDTKAKEILEKRIAQQTDRLEILEALNDRPRASVQDRLRSEHKDLFERWIRSGGRDEGAVREGKALAEKAREYKDVSIGTVAAGGYAVPEEIASMVDKILLKTSPITQYVKNVRSSTSDYKELVSENLSGYAWAAETTDRSANTTTSLLRERVPTWGELYAHPRTTNWALQDAFFNVQQWIVDEVAEAHAVGLSAAIWNGNGSGKPTGMTNTAPTTGDDNASPTRSHEAFEYIPMTATSSPFTNNGIGGNDVIDLVYALNPRMRGNARFASNTTTQGHLRKLKDSNGQYLWQPSLQAGQPDRLIGYEMFTWEEMGDPTTADALPVAFGDFSRAYTLATRAEMSVLVDPYATKGYTAYFIDRRYGGIVTNNSALKFLKVALS